MAAQPDGGLVAERQYDKATRAAEYVRMSTDHQQYSIANQRDVIARYAREHGLEVVRTYADAGKSGLTVQGRDGLQSLLEDVVCGRADYGVVLVYDVSRWGRFQDCDEAAHYEYMCRRGGMRVEYVSELFANDGSPMSAVMKGLKRVMAGEYSRELSEKVFFAKCRGIRMGYRQGGAAGYGLRRLVVDSQGRPRAILKVGQQKAIHEDRIVLVPGPPEELAVLRWIFRQVAYRGRRPTSIAESLNRRGVVPPDGRPWTRGRVRCMLSNEKYIGNLVYAQTTAKLKSKYTRRPAEQWIRRDRAFPPVVKPALFDKAQAAMAEWPRPTDLTEALAKLKALFARRGKLSGEMIDSTEGMPCSRCYRRLWGSLVQAYRQAGYHPGRDYAFQEGYVWRRRRVALLRDEIFQALVDRGVPVRRESSKVVAIGGRCRVAIALAQSRSVNGCLRAKAQIRVRPAQDCILVGRVNAQGTDIHDYHLVDTRSPCVLLGVKAKWNGEKRHESTDLGSLLDLLATRR